MRPGPENELPRSSRYGGETDRKITFGRAKRRCTAVFAEKCMEKDRSEKKELKTVLCFQLLYFFIRMERVLRYAHFEEG